MTAFVIRIDDVVPGFPFDRFAPIEFALLEAGVRPLIGVVPENRDAELDFRPHRSDFWDIIRNWQSLGWTIAQHGFRHQYITQGKDWLGLQRKSEFLGLPESEQLRMLVAGKQIMEREAVWQGIFMAPSHSFDDATLLALSFSGFRAVTDGWGVYPFAVNGLTFVPQLFPTFRNFGFGVYTVCLHVGTMSDTRIAEVAAEIRRVGASCITFEEALKIRVPNVLAAPIRGMTRHALPAYWRMRAR